MSVQDDEFIVHGRVWHVSYFGLQPITRIRNRGPEARALASHGVASGTFVLKGRDRSSEVYFCDIKETMFRIKGVPHMYGLKMCQVMSR